MADKNPIVEAASSLSSEDFSTGYTPLENLKAFTALGKDLGDRGIIGGDSAVNMLDTLQSLGVIVAPGYELQQASKNSRALDALRSPGYLAEQQIEASQQDPNATFLEGVGRGVRNVISGDNIIPDALAQVPYLAMGPAGRLASVGRFEKATSIAGKVAKYTLGTNEAATVNRIAALSGGMEGAGAYSQTYDRATAEGLSEEEATNQARQAAAVSGVLGAVLGRLTPGFELHPTGKGLTGGLAAHLSAIGGEAVVEEGGLAVAQTIFENKLTGKDDLTQGAGEAFGQAAAISGAFSGALRSPRIAMEAAHDVGKGVGAALKLAGKNAVLPEDAATEAAAKANEAPSAASTEEVLKAAAAADREAEFQRRGAELSARHDANPNLAPAGPQTAEEQLYERRMDQMRALEAARDYDGMDALAAKFEAEDEAFSLAQKNARDDAFHAADEASIPTIYPPGEFKAEPLTGEAAQSAKDDAFNQVQAEDIPTVYPPGVDPTSADIPTLQPPAQDTSTVTLTPDQVQYDAPANAPPAEIKTDSTSPAARTVLVAAQTDARIESTTGAEQADAISRREELESSLGAAQDVVRAMSPANVEKKVAEAAAGNEQSARVVDAIRHTDATKLPASALSKEEKPIVQLMLDLKDFKLDKTSREIFEDGHSASFVPTRGLNDFLQKILSANAAGVKGRNQGSANLERFVKHLTDRADAFMGALAEVEATGQSVTVKGTETLNERGQLVDKPFILHPNKNSKEVAQRVLADATQAQKALDVARESFPSMFSKKTAPVVAPVRSAGTSQKTPAKSNAASVAKKTAPKEEAPTRSAPSEDVIEFTPATPVAEKAAEKTTPAVAKAEPVVELSLKDEPAFERGNTLVDFTDHANGDEPLADRNGVAATRVTAPGSKGYIAYIPTIGDGRMIRGAHVEKTDRGQGFGKANLLYLAEESLKANAPLTSDASVSYAQLRVYESLKADGELTFEYADPAAAATVLAEAAAIKNDSKLSDDEKKKQLAQLKLEGRTPVIVNIKPAAAQKFTTFNGINRFRQAFRPSGSGLLARSYTELLALLQAGSAAEQAAGKVIADTVPTLAKSIRDYMEKTLNGPVSDSDKTKLKDAIAKNPEFADYGDKIWVNLLTQNAAGGYELNEDAVQAAAIASLMQLFRSSFQGNTATLEEDEIDDQYYQWVNNVAKDSMRILGMESRNTESITLTQGIPTSLALTVLQALSQVKIDGEETLLTVERELTTDAVGGKKTLTHVNLHPKMVTSLREHPSFADTMRRFFGDAEDDTIHYGSPPQDVKPTVRNSRTEITPEQKTALFNRQQGAHYRNTGFMNVARALGTRAYLALTTGFAEVSEDPKLEKLSKSLTKGMKGELAAVARYNAGIEQHATETGKTPEQVATYFAYEALKNGRSFSGYSPQNKKTLREFLTAGREVLDLTNEKHVKWLKFAIAQSIGIKTDVNSLEEALIELEAKIPELSEKALALYAASQGGEKSAELFQLLDRDKVYEPKELHGLIILGKMLANPAATDFENTLTFEIDGKTNGPFNAEMLFGLHSMDEATWTNLEQGGYFHGIEGATIASMREQMAAKRDTADLYERVADAASTFDDPLIVLSGLANPQGEVSRAAAKEAVTPLVYGSGVNSLGEVFTRRINSGLADRLRLLLKQQNQGPLSRHDAKLLAQLRLAIESVEVASLGPALAEDLEAAYVGQKRQVNYVTKMMIQATSLHAAVRQALFMQARNKKLAERRAAGWPKQYELSREDYKEILASLPGTTINVPGLGEVSVGESAYEGRSSVAVKGAGRNATSLKLSIPSVQNPGVSIVANLTIAAGDASMMNKLYQTPQVGLEVFDGFEMRVTDIDSMGQKLNEAAVTSLSDSLLDGFTPLLEFVQAHPQVFNRANLLQMIIPADTLTEYHKIKAAKGKPSAEDLKLVNRVEAILVQFYSDTSILRTMEKLTARFKKGTVGSIAALKAELEHTSAKIKNGRAQLDAVASSFGQMAGGQSHTTVPKSEARTEPATRDFREGWDERIAAGFAASNNQLEREGVIALLDGHKWKNKTHALIWNKLKATLPADLLISLARNEADWNALNQVGHNGIVYGTVKGTSYYSSGEINLATADPVTMLHEMIHQVITGNVSHYFSNINTVPAALRSPINDLHQLLKRFMTLQGGSELGLVQGFIRELEAKGDTAAAVDEMIAHVLSNETLINELTPNFFTRVVTRVKQILAELFGTAATEPFMDEVMKAFNGLAGGHRMEVNHGVRASPVLDKTAAAFRAVAKKLIRGQITAAPRVKYNDLLKISGTYNLSFQQKILYNRVWMLMRMDSRSGNVEKFASEVLRKHPNAALFNGSQDAVAAVMALCAADPTFAAQADVIWKASQPTTLTVSGVLDTVLGEAALTDSAAILNEALDTMRAEGDYHLSFLGTATQRLDRMGNEWMEKVSDKAHTASLNAPSGVAEGLGAIHALTSENGAEAFGKSLMHWANTIVEKRWFQDLTAALVGSQKDTNAIYRQVNSLKHNIAQTRSLFTTTLPAQLKTLFPADFAGWNHLFTHFGRVDAGVLGASAAEMYQNDAARAKAIKALESKIPNAWDAKNLAHYLVHGTVEPGSPHALLRNARAIADNLNGTKRKASDSLVTDVDQLVTLHAIEKLSQQDRARIAGYFTTHPQAMNNLTGMLQKVADEEAKQAKDSHRYVHWKGALPLSLDPRTSIVIAGVVKGAELEQLGYVKKQRYQSAANDPAKNLFYYVRDNAPPPVFSQGILSTVQQTSQGVNYTTASTISPEVGTFISDARLVNYITNNQGTNSNLAPVFNLNGDIVAYERLLDRKLVQEMTKSNNTLLHISIGSKLGRITEERMANRFNQEAVGLLVKQWEMGKQEAAEAQYEDVSNSTDKQVQRAWALIPAPTKKALEVAFGGPVMIRKDLVANTLGYHKAGILDIYTGNASVNAETRRAFFGLAQTVFLGKSGAEYLFIAENAIKEGVASAKDWIIVRSLSVAINNAMASMNLVIANGVPLKELFSSYREGMRDVRAYTRLQKDLVRLQVQIAGATPAEAAKLRTLQHAKDQAIKRLAIYPLIEAGELSDLPEGLEDTPQHSYMGDLGGWLNNHLRVIHPKLPMVAANAVIAKDTAFHDAISKAIQAGDFLGKWAVYKHMVKSGKSVEVARDTVRDEFISYGTNPGRFRGALEDFGLVWWSQFTLRSQKVLLRRFRRNPFSFFLGSVSAGVTGTDAPGDAALPERHWDSGTGLDNVLNAPSAHIWSKVF